MFLFAQIQLHDHPSVFGVAEFLFAIAAELSVCLCHIAAQWLLKFLRDAAPRDHIAHAGVPYIHDAGPVAVLLRCGLLYTRSALVLHKCPIFQRFV